MARSIQNLMNMNSTNRRDVCEEALSSPLEYSRLGQLAMYFALYHEVQIQGVTHSRLAKIGNIKSGVTEDLVSLTVKDRLYQ